MTDQTQRSEQTAADFDPETGGRDMIDLSNPPTERIGADADLARAPDDIEEGERPVAHVGDLEGVTRSIVTALKTVYDPEIPVDIYELGLIYRVDYEDPGDVAIEMTLTAPGCPVAGEMPGWVENAVRKVEGIRSVTVSMTFEPPWSPERMSDEARLELGWM